MTQNGLFCADVPLSNYSLTHVFMRRNHPFRINCVTTSNLIVQFGVGCLKLKHRTRASVDQRSGPRVIIVETIRVNCSYF